MKEWFCRKCNSKAMTQENNPKSSVLDNGVIHRIDGLVCSTCTEKLKQPVLMWPLPEAVI
jgi:hypothetical protein